MKKAFDQNVSRAKPRLKLGGPASESSTDTQAADEAWVYEVAAQVAGHPGSIEEPALTARELLATAERAEEEPEEVSTRSRVETTLRETARASEPVVQDVVQEERVTVAVGARARGAVAHGALPSAPVTSAGPAPASPTATRRRATGRPRRSRASRTVRWSPTAGRSARSRAPTASATCAGWPAR